MSVALSDFTAQVARLLFGLSAIGFLLLKLTAILAFAFIAHRLMQHRSAAERHFMWSVAFGSVSVLTLLAAVVPSLKVRVPTNAMVTSVLRVLPNAPSAVPTDYLKMRVGSYPSVGTLESPRVDANQDYTRGYSVINVARNDSAIVPARVSQSFLQNFEGVLSMLFLAWFLGALFLLARLANSHRKLFRIVRSAHVPADPAVLACARRLSTRFSLQRAPRILLHKKIELPCTGGWLRPVVLLPDASREWSPSRLHAVLSHELAHVSRHDYATQLLATVTCAAFWFHPMVWVAARKLRNDCERAADDCAIATIPSAQYAEHLLAIAAHASFASSTPTVALGMAQRTQLEWRIRSMLNSGTSRVVPSPHTRRRMRVSALLVMMPLAALRTGGGVETAWSSAPGTARLDASPLNAVPFPGQSRAVTKALAVPDSIFDRTIDVGPLDRFTLNIDPAGDLVFHTSGEQTIRVRAVVPRTVAIDKQVLLSRTSSGAEFTATHGTAKRVGNRSRYEIWVPANMPLYIQPTIAGNINQLKARVSNLPGVHEIQIDGSVNISCAKVIFAHVIGTLHGKVTCGLYSFPAGRTRYVRVLVNGQQWPDTVESVDTSTEAATFFAEKMGSLLPLAQFKSDSITISVGKGTVYYMSKMDSVRRLPPGAAKKRK
ncbi:MAG: M56 family metallopeptidase [Gemmatimonas sp.]